MREQILDEIRRIAEANGGKPPGRSSFERETGIKPSGWCGLYWARWGDALLDAGFQPNALQGKADQNFVLKKIAEALRHHGRIPTEAELRIYRQRDPAFPSHNTPYSHFGSKAVMLSKIAEWVTTRSEFSDIAGLLPTSDGKPQSPLHRLAEEGFVYLIRAGVRYKIGRSDELERRVKEIRVALPEAATLIHSIRTDDPAGIEAYWHRRFADRRANGEWFKLTASDVAAFKRRKYQ
jgi:Meiotically up-regulated gene 113